VTQSADSGAITNIASQAQISGSRLNYTLLPTYPKPIYRLDLPWNEHLKNLHDLRERGETQFHAFIMSATRQFRGHAHIYLGHGNFIRYREIVGV
jgi:hypothetical protein